MTTDGDANLLLAAVLLMDRITVLENQVAAMTIALKQIAAGGFDHPTEQSNITCSVTAVDGDAAFATTLSNTPVGAPQLFVNGVAYEIGNGVKTLAAYVSGDGGATARAYGAMVAGDSVRWNGSIAGFQLAASDRATLVYNA